MQPDAGKKETDVKDGGSPSDVRLQAFRQRQSPRDLVLVKWAFWAVIVAVVAFVIFIVWGLATHEPSPSPFESDF